VFYASVLNPSITFNLSIQISYALRLVFFVVKNRVFWSYLVYLFVLYSALKY